MKELDSPYLARLSLYRFLSLALYEPDATLLDLAANEDDRWQLVEAAETLLGEEGAQVAAAAMDALSPPAADRAHTLQKLRVEYNRLFVGPASPPCPPYESVYSQDRPRKDWGTVLGPSACAVAEALRGEGLAIALDYAELADHAAIELEFAYYLLARGAQAPEEAEVYAERENQFFAQHLQPWLVDWGKRVTEQARHPFYREVGRFLEMAIRADAVPQAA